MISDHLKQSEVGSNKIIKRMVNLTFRPSTPITKIREMESKNLSLIKNPRWYFVENQYIKKKIYSILQITQKLFINQFTVHYSRHDRIIKEIENIQFINLNSLSLPGNKISSINSLQTISATRLEFLSLRNNRISNCKALKKCFFKLVMHLVNLSDNFVSQFKDLWSFSLPCLQIMTLNGNSKAVLEWGIVKSDINLSKMQKLFSINQCNINKNLTHQKLINLGIQIVKV